MLSSSRDTNSKQHGGNQAPPVNRERDPLIDNFFQSVERTLIPEYMDAYCDAKTEAEAERIISNVPYQ